MLIKSNQINNIIKKENEDKNIQVKYIPGSNILIIIALNIFLFFFLFHYTQLCALSVCVVFDNVVDQ